VTELAFAGAVLCGGASTRMGTDKALVEIDGRALARRVADALQAAGADPVVAIGGDVDALRALGLEVVPDAHPGEGPLGGILTALDALGARAPLVAVLACDLVAPDPDTIRATVSAAAPEGVDVAAPRVAGRRHLHHAVWRTAARPVLAAAFAAGERAPRRAVAALTVAAVDGIAAELVADADDPATLAAARATVARRRRPGTGGPSR
jgi:molybdopterin-guanine dinucleotide biosynthesis protein A